MGCALASIGTVGDCFDSALAESVIGLYKTERVRHEGLWRGVDDLGFREILERFLARKSKSPGQRHDQTV